MSLSEDVLAKDWDAEHLQYSNEPNIVPLINEGARMFVNEEGRPLIASTASRTRFTDATARHWLKKGGKIVRLHR